MRKKHWIILLLIGMAIITCITGVIIVQVLNSPALQSGIQQASKSITVLRDLQQKVAKEYQSDQVEIGVVNGTNLRVSFVNSPLSELSSSSLQEEAAKKVARFAMENYQDIASIQNIQVIFAQKQNYGIVHINQSKSYFFSIEELKK